jgi:hypothetical protein
MPRTEVMRALLEQSQGVDDELATKYQERLVHRASAKRAVDFRFKLPDNDKRALVSPSHGAAAAAGSLAGRPGHRGSV